MELHELATIAAGMKTLTELQEFDAKSSAEFMTFLDQVSSACADAYTNFSKALGKVVALPNPPDRASYDRVSTELVATYDHQWFKNVADVCARLKAADRAFGAAIDACANRLRKGVPSTVPAPNSQPDAVDRRQRDADTLGAMLGVLKMHEGGLEEEIRTKVFFLQEHLAEGIAKGDISEAKQYAKDLQSRISALLDEINQTVLAVQGTSTNGASTTLLGREEIARRVLADDPHKLLKLNAFILCVIVLLGASVLQYVSIIAFVALTAFALAALCAMNTIMLLSSGKIDQVTWLEGMRLSLTYTFVPIMSQILGGAARREPSGGGGKSTPRARRASQKRANKSPRT